MVIIYQKSAAGFLTLEFHCGEYALPLTCMLGSVVKSIYFFFFLFYFFFLEENNFRSVFVCLGQLFSVITVEEDL